MDSKALLSALALMAFASHASAQNTAYERVLFPVYAPASVPVPGAFGSRWITETSARNDSTAPIDVFQVQCVYFCTSIGATCGIGKPLAPGARVSGFAIHDEDPRQPGVFVYIPRAAMNDVSMNLRVRDISRSATSFGTEVPVVREKDQLEGTTTLLDVPTDARFRQHLRIYGISSPTGASDMRVRIFELDGVVPLFETVVRIVPPQRRALLQNADDPDVGWPGYAEISNLQQVLPQQGAPARVRVELEPLVEGLRYWAFVAITNNDTQQVTTVTPH